MTHAERAHEEMLRDIIGYGPTDRPETATAIMLREQKRRYARDELRGLQLAGVIHRKGTTTPWT